MPSPRQRRPSGGRHRRSTSVPFEEVVENHQNELFATALRILGERTLAEDALQDTFLKAYKALPSLKPGSNLRAWLFRILVNTAYDQLDRQKTHTRAIDSLGAGLEADQRGYEDDADEERRDLRSRVEVAVRSLPAKYRDALLLRAIQGLPYSDMAEALDIPENTARSLVHRGKRLLIPKLAHLMQELD